MTLLYVIILGPFILAIVLGVLGLLPGTSLNTYHDRNGYPHGTVDEDAYDLYEEEDLTLEEAEEEYD